MSAIFVYVVTPSETMAHDIARQIVSERLAACANIMPQMSSVYHWQGKIEEARESVLIFKTRRDLFTRLEERVRALHSYQTPCIVALPIEAGSKAYLDWISAETSSACCDPE